MQHWCLKICSKRVIEVHQSTRQGLSLAFWHYLQQDPQQQCYATLVIITILVSSVMVVKMIVMVFDHVCAAGYSKGRRQCPPRGMWGVCGGIQHRLPEADSSAVLGPHKLQCNQHNPQASGVLCMLCTFVRLECYVIMCCHGSIMSAMNCTIYMFILL